MILILQFVTPGQVAKAIEIATGPPTTAFADLSSDSDPEDVPIERPKTPATASTSGVQASGGRQPKGKGVGKTTTPVPPPEDIAMNVSKH